VNRYPGGRYLMVRDMDEAEIVCAYIEGKPGALSREGFIAHFLEKASPGFDPDQDLARIGVANQTTMLASESIAIGARIQRAIVAARGEAYAAESYRSFGTICSATQERQDAVKEMMKDPPEVMIVIGGYNSSNTNHLAHLCRQHTTTYHVSDSACIDVESGAIRHKPALDAHAPERTDRDWLPTGAFTLGITAGASTPNNKIGEAVVRVLKIRGIELDAAEGAIRTG
jgi:4-hydroxy-3-methylbut-2-enyl diphosphate reductase